MQEQIATWIMAAASLAAMVLLLIAIYTWPRGGRRRCPGSRGWENLWNPGRWIRRSDCWHDLHGLRSSPEDEVRCPECGRSTPIRGLLRDGRRLRVGLVGIVLGMIGIGSHLGIALHSGRPLRSVPTTALVLLSNTSAGGYRSTIRREVDERLEERSIVGFDARRLSSALVRDLRADGQTWNAHSAVEDLYGMWPDSRHALERELVAGDRQSRKIAASMLRRKRVTPSERLLEISVDDLADDAELHRVSALRSNHRHAASYLIDHYRHARSLVHEAITSDDPQQSLMAMVICGFAEDPSAIELVVPRLVADLRDGPGNARLAAATLFRFGPAVVEALRRHAEDDDRQCREAIRSIIERLEHPDRTWDQCENRMPRISWTTHDPLSLDFWEASSP